MGSFIMGDTSEFFWGAQHRANITGRFNDAGNTPLGFGIVDVLEVPGQ